jgi:microcystin-dependent protein
VRAVLKLIAQVVSLVVLAAALPANAAEIPCAPSEIKLFAGNSLPSPPWIEADGKILQISDYLALFQRIGTTFGGDGITTFAVPNLSDNAPLEHTSYLICANGNELSSLFDSTVLGEIVLYAGAQLPRGWVLANGQLLQIAHHVPLHTIYGNEFGGDGISTFAVPNLPSLSSGVNYVVVTDAKYPTGSVDSYLGETTLLAGRIYPEQTMIPADGQVLKINRNLRLFAVVGPYFGRNEMNDFDLPDLTPFVPDSHLRYFITDRGEFPCNGNQNCH